MSGTVECSFKPVYDIVHARHLLKTNVWHDLMLLLSQCLTLLNITDFMMVNTKLANIEAMTVMISAREISLNTNFLPQSTQLKA
jgi:hypothetical protein